MTGADGNPKQTFNPREWDQEQKDAWRTAVETIPEARYEEALKDLEAIVAKDREVLG